MKVVLNGQLEISKNTTYDMLKNSGFYRGQPDKRFFWLSNLCEMNGLPDKFKVGLLFKNNLLIRVELYCVDENITSEEARYKRNEMIVDCLKTTCQSDGGSIKNSFDQRNGYSSINIFFEPRFEFENKI